MKGLAQANKRAGRLASEGMVTQYIHAGSRCAFDTSIASPGYCACCWDGQHRNTPNMKQRRDCSQCTTSLHLLASMGAE